MVSPLRSSLSSTGPDRDVRSPLATDTDACELEAVASDDHARSDPAEHIRPRRENQPLNDCGRPRPSGTGLRVPLP